MLPIAPLLPDRHLLPASDVPKSDNFAVQTTSLRRTPSTPLLLQGLTRISLDRNNMPAALARSPSREGSIDALAASFSALPRTDRPARLDASYLSAACAALDAQFGAATVNSRLQHDVFPDIAALQRQLTHEAKIDITLDDYVGIEPFGGVAAHGVPEGWRVVDRLSHDANGLTKLRSTLTGPNGESGMVVRSFDGHTLYLDKAYKSTLPTRLTGVPGFTRQVMTINYLTARSCRILGVTPKNLQRIKVNRLQHRAALAHLDWLMRKFPQSSMAQLIDHTTWARSYIRETAKIVGHVVQPAPTIDLQGDPTWIRKHPGATPRKWDYLAMETERLTIKHVTGQKLPRVDDALADWRTSATHAIATFKAQRCAGLGAAEADALTKKIDNMLTRRLDAIRNEEQALRTRYDLSEGTAPRHVNFDVTFRTAPQNPASATS